MKKTFIIMICSLSILLSLVACTKEEEVIIDEEPENLVVEINNMGDAFGNQIGWEMDDKYIKILTEDYVYEGKMSEGLYEEIDKIDFLDEDRDAKYTEILKAVPIEKKTPRSEFALTPEKIATLIGEKGQKLLDMGMSNFGWNLGEENAQFFMETNGYYYTITMEEHIDESDDMNVDDVIAECTIKAIEEGN